MTIKQNGGVFGRNPTFNDVDVEGDLTVSGVVNIKDINIIGNVDVTGTVTADGLIVDGNISSTQGGTAAAPKFTLSGSATTGIFTPASNSVGVSASGVERLRVNTTGIDVTGTAVTDGLIASNVSGTTLIQAVGVDSNGFADVEIKSTGTAGSSRLYFSDTAGQSGSIKYSHSSDAMLFSTAGTSRLNIASNGDINFYATDGITQAFHWDATDSFLGLGITAPVRPLHVQLANDGGSVSTAIFENSASLAGSQSEIILVSGGNTSRGASISSYNESATGQPASMLFSTSAAYATPTERMRIDSSGGLILVGSTAQKATGTTWSNPSDQRLKTDIRDYTKGSAELMQVRVREWLYNGKGGTVDGMAGLGVIADEVMTVLPDTVETYKAFLEETDELPTAIKKFDATEITWLLVTSLQEALQKIETLEARVAALEP
jgi:hypothetical protein